VEQKKTDKTLDEQLSFPWMGIRRDLLLHPGPADVDGQPTWVVEDPLRGNNYQLGYTEAQLFMALTREATVEAAVKRLYRTTNLRPAPEDILNFIGMLQQQHLTRASSEHVIEEEKKSKIKSAQPSLGKRLMFGYVYFRVPLAHPDAWLTRMYPWVSWLWAPFMRMLYVAAGISGVLLTAQQAELYFNSVSHLFTPQGALSFTICLILIKIGHELSHAFTAKSLGLHVRSIGVAFIVLWPLLYTDTTDAWKIPDRRRRLRIDAAGVLFELVVAGLALLAWALLPDGILRSLMFFVSGTSVLSTLLINLNPFTRFDGYYVLMDLWGVDNLQPRAFALFKYSLRRLLFDWQAAPPERHPQHRRMVLYAAGAALYRVFVAISIGLAVYHLFFQALGAVVLLVELWIFLLYPIWKELVFVAKNRRFLGRPWRLAVTALGFVAFIWGMALPIARVYELPALVVLDSVTPVYTPSKGYLRDDLPAMGSHFRADQKLVRLGSHDLHYRLVKAGFDLDVINVKLNTVGSAGEQGGYRNWLLAEQRRLVAVKDKIGEAIDLLDVHAPMDGTVVDVNQSLRRGDYVDRGTYLLTMARSNRRYVRAFVDEKDFRELGDFSARPAELHCPDLETPVVELRLREVHRFPVRVFPNQSLFDIAGGPVVSQPGEGDRRMARAAHFPILFDLAGENLEHLVHGTPCRVWVFGRRRSLATSINLFFGRLFAEEGFL